jgi:Xaa-Pro aminopeptidase
VDSVDRVDSRIHGVRLAAVRDFATRQGVDVLLISPGTDMKYLVGCGTASIERFTCLVVPAGDSSRAPVLFCPVTDVGNYRQDLLADLGIAVTGWQDGEDVYATSLAGIASSTAATRRYWLGLRDAMVGTRQRLAGEIIRAVRSCKDGTEIQHLRTVAAAIDRVHVRMPQFLVPGRTEREAASLIGSGGAVHPPHRAWDRPSGP